jgi:hypothetical protein
LPDRDFVARVASTRIFGALLAAVVGYGAAEDDSKLDSNMLTNSPWVGCMEMRAQKREKVAVKPPQPGMRPFSNCIASCLFGFSQSHLPINRGPESGAPQGPNKKVIAIALYVSC